MNTLQKCFLLFVTSLLLCARSASGQTPPPRIFFTDIISGPNSGGESVGGVAGAYVTIYGNSFGTSQGSSTVALGSSCSSAAGTLRVVSWGMPWLWYQKIVVQLGASCTTGRFVVTVGGQASTSTTDPLTGADNATFTVRPGSIYCVAVGGSDSAAGTLANNTCWATVYHAVTTAGAGSITYVKNGIVETTVHDYGAVLSTNARSGTAGNPIAIVAYPGASVTIGNTTNGGIDRAIRAPNIGASNHWVFAGLTVRSPNIAFEDAGGSVDWRVIALDVSCPVTVGYLQGACIDCATQANTMWYLGNYSHDNAQVVQPFTGNGTKGFHNMYFSTDCNHVDAGWNSINGDTGTNACDNGQGDHRCNAGRGIQFHSSPTAGGGSGDPSGHNQYDLHAHDNLIQNIHLDGINFATVDPSKGTVEAYNNLLIHVGTGVLNGDIGSFDCIVFQGTVNNGPVGTGTAYAYNNTCYDAGSAGGSTAGALEGMPEQGGGQLFYNFSNNIIYQVSNQAYMQPNHTGSFVSGSNNLWFGGSWPNASWANFFAGNIAANPQVIAPGTNFHLSGTSPAINAASAAHVPSWDRDGIARPQGAAYDIGAYEYNTGSPSAPPAPTLLSVTPLP